MSELPRFPADSAQFMEVVAAVERCLDVDCRLPDWPFRASVGFATVYEYDSVLAGQFGQVLAALAAGFGDSDVYVVGVAPNATYYRDGYGMYPGFSVSADAVAAGYGAGLRYEPGGDPTGALVDSLDVVAMAGSSCAWSVWAQRDWEIGLLLTATQTGPWLSPDVPWFPGDVDLDSIRSPTGWGLSLSASDRAVFERNIHERGSGPLSPPN